MTLTLTNDKRRQKMVTLMMDDETQRQLDELAADDETQPGNRSNTVRSLVRLAHKKKIKNNSK